MLAHYFDNLANMQTKSPELYSAKLRTSEKRRAKGGKKGKGGRKRKRRKTHCTPGEISQHDARQRKPERPRHVDQLQPPVGLREKVRRPVVRDSDDSEETPVKRRVLGDGLPEGSTLKVDGEGRNLLRETE